MLMLGFVGFLFFRLKLLGRQAGKNQAGKQCFVLFTAPKMVEDATPAQEDMPEAAEEEEVTTGGQEVVQAEVHGGAEDYPLENEEEEEEEEDEEEEMRTRRRIKKTRRRRRRIKKTRNGMQRWPDIRYRKSGLIKIRVCFNSSG